MTLLVDGDSMLSVTASTLDASNVTLVPLTIPSVCQKILYMTIADSSVRIWDLVLLVPSLFFLLYLVCKMRSAVARLQRNNSPILTALFILVFASHCISIIRCIVSMAVHSSNYSNYADRAVWLVLKFFLLATELSVVTFGLLFGHLDSRTSIERVIFVTFSISLIYSTTQGVLEFYYIPNSSFHGIQDGSYNYTLFGHGGMIFWFVSSVCLFLVYTTICILPFTPLRNRFTFPTKKSFYCYCMILAILNATQATGSMLLFNSVIGGMCVVDVTAYLYFAGFSPLVYLVFLYKFFSASQTTSILFSYRSQVDEEDEVSLPHQQSINYSPAEVMDDTSSSFDSTHFNNSFGQNPLCPSLTIHPELPAVSERYNARSREINGTNKSRNIPT